MCGIAGFFTGTSFRNSQQRRRDLSAMTDALRHRGPDAEGFWTDDDAGVALGHRRLSILDLSPTGAQPIGSSDGRHMMVFNGEIYNHMTLRRLIEEQKPSISWRGTSDSETLIEAISHWGLPEALRQCCGMFALAVWDKQEKALSLARDNLGEKPLYFGRTDEGFVFGSELKALCAAPGMRPTLDHRAIKAYLNYGYVPEGFCIFRDVSKLKPGCIATIRSDRDLVEIETFLGFEELAISGRNAAKSDATFDLQARSQEMETLLGTVVDEQMLSDVPLGCFLSGGVDSSLVASLMQAQRDTQTKTFSIGFSEARFNEAEHAAKVARHLGTEHTEFMVSEEDALALVPELPDIYDEPFADSSQIPTALLCREARKFVTVALTGDGADEIFGGYNRHIYGPLIWEKASRVPGWLRAPAGRMASAFEGVSVNENSALRRLATKARLPVTAIDKMARLGAALGQADRFDDIYAHFTQVFANDDPEIGARYRAKAEHLFRQTEKVDHLTPKEWMMAMDAVTYLPGDILVKVDRAAMSASLETRAPFLDARIVRAAWRLPEAARINGKTGKVILREILYRHVPKALIERPKQGFAVPLDRWLRGALRGWADDLLARQDLLSLAEIGPDAVQRLWQDHLQERANNGQKLWVLLMLMSWLSHYAQTLQSAEWGDRIAV